MNLHKLTAAQYLVLSVLPCYLRRWNRQTAKHSQLSENIFKGRWMHGLSGFIKN